jgi:hypothetical protein
MGIRAGERWPGQCQINPRRKNHDSRHSWRVHLWLAQGRESMRMGSDDPTDIDKTHRVLTIMHASEY